MSGQKDALEGANGGGSSDNESNGGKESKSPVYMTTEEFNKGATAREKALLVKLDKSYAERETKLREEWKAEREAERKAFEERIAALSPKEKKEARDERKEAEKAELKLEEHPEWKKAQATTAALQKKLDEAEKREKSERDKRRGSALDSSLRKALTAAGVRPELIDDQVDVLKARGKVRYAADDSDDIVYVADKDADPVGLDEGLAAWAKTQAAQHYLSPKGAKGSGGAPGNGGLFGSNQQIQGGGVLGQLAQFHRERGGG